MTSVGSKLFCRRLCGPDLHHTPSHHTLSHHTPSHHIPSHHTQSHHTPSHHTPSHHIPSHHTPSQHTPSACVHLGLISHMCGHHKWRSLIKFSKFNIPVI